MDYSAAIMGIFDRAKRAISSNVNSLLERAEDPRKMVELNVEEMREHLARARQDVIAAVAAEKQTRKKTEEVRTQQGRWEHRAELAVRAGDDALARAALEQKGRLTAELTSLEATREQQLALALKLREDLESMEARFKELDAKKGTIAAKAEIARAGGGSEALGASGGSGNAFEAFRQMEDKIERTDAEAAALRELDEDAHKDAELESKFRKLEREGSGSGATPAVDDELAALKKRVRIQ